MSAKPFCTRLMGSLGLLFSVTCSTSKQSLHLLGVLQVAKAVCPNMIYSHTDLLPFCCNSWCLSCCARLQPMLSWPIQRRRHELRSPRPIRRKRTSELLLPKWQAMGAKVCLGWFSKCVALDSQVHTHRWFWGPRQVQNICLF